MQVMNGTRYVSAINVNVNMEKKIMKTIKRMHYPVIKFKHNDSIINKASNTKIYRDASLLPAGIYTDSMSQTPTEYTPESLNQYATNWGDNFINLDHTHDVLSRIGRVFNQRCEDGIVKGDLHIYPITQASRDTISLIDNNLVNWVSVEIMTEDTWNEEKKVWSAGDMEFFGLAICTTPAAKNAKIIEDGIDVSDIYYKAS